MESQDFQFICGAMYPMIPAEVLARMIRFNQRLYEDTMVHRLYGRKGSPWEFNLRDIFRWCDLMIHSQQPGTYGEPELFLDTIYLQRFRAIEDRDAALRLFNEVFESSFQPDAHPLYHVTPHHVQIGMHLFTSFTNTPMFIAFFYLSPCRCCMDVETQGAI